jgi:hypothetical protein
VIAPMLASPVVEAEPSDLVGKRSHRALARLGIAVCRVAILVVPKG